MPFKKGDPKPPGSGRKAGSVNKSTADIRELAQDYCESALKELSRLATKAKNENARVAAIKEILDRGYGKSLQPIEAQVEHGISDELKEILDRSGETWGLPSQAKAQNGAQAQKNGAGSIHRPGMAAR